MASSSSVCSCASAAMTYTVPITYCDRRATTLTVMKLALGAAAYAGRKCRAGSGSAPLGDSRNVAGGAGRRHGSWS